VSLKELIALRATVGRGRLPGRPTLAVISGPRRSVFRGRGMEFEESRPYQPGDDMRQLDWKVTARSGRPHTKQFREERARPVLVWVDLRGAMHFATKGVFKSVQACRAAALLAWRASGHGDRVGGMAFSDHAHHEHRPGQGHHAVLRLLRALVTIQNERQQQPGAEPVRGLGAMLARLRRIARPGSLIVMLSDFRGLEADSAEEMVRLSRHTDMIAILIQDPLERELPPPGRYPIVAGDRRWVLDSGSGPIRQAYAERFLERRSALAGICRGCRAPLVDLATDADPARVLYRHLPAHWG
jgi:uncharacterized protein (DUF58 family)